MACNWLHKKLLSFRSFFKIEWLCDIYSCLKLVLSNIIYVNKFDKTNKNYKMQTPVYLEYYDYDPKAKT